MTDTIEIAFCFNDGFTLPAAVAMLSLLETNRGQVRIHALTDPASRAAPLLRQIAARYACEVHVVDAALEIAHRFDPTTNYETDATAIYRRIFLPNLLPTLDRVLYLDCDAIVRGSLRDVWKTDLSDAPIAAVTDPWMVTLADTRRDYPGGYFNSGVMLMDLARWRAEKVTEHCIADIQERQTRNVGTRGDAVGHHNDQTPLNAVLRGRWRRVAPRWNCTTYHAPGLATDLDMNPSVLADSVANATIVHFLGAYKPWLAGCEAMTLWHREFDATRRLLERSYPVDHFVWPGAFTVNAAARRLRRMMAMQLVHMAQSQGFSRCAVLLTGLLAREILIVAREQRLSVACLVSENPVFSGGVLDDIPILSVDEAIAAGHRDLIIGDFRRLPRVRENLLAQARLAEVDLRLVTIDG